MKKKKTVTIGVSALLIIIGTALLFFVFITTSPSSVVKQYVIAITSQLGNAIGVSVGVEENSFNKLAQELDAYEHVIKEREVDLNEREIILIEKEEEIEKSNNLIFISLGVGILILILLLVNFYLDWKRGKIQPIRIKRLD